MGFEPTSIQEVAVVAHEYYTHLRTAGFTRLESLYLVSAMLTGGPKSPEDSK